MGMGVVVEGLQGFWSGARGGGGEKVSTGVDSDRDNDWVDPDFLFVMCDVRRLISP